MVASSYQHIIFNSNEIQGVKNFRVHDQNSLKKVLRVRWYLKMENHIPHPRGPYIEVHCGSVPEIFLGQVSGIYGYLLLSDARIPQE